MYSFSAPTLDFFKVFFVLIFEKENKHEKINFNGLFNDIF